MHPRATFHAPGSDISSPTVTSNAAHGRAEGDVAQELFPDHEGDIGEGPDVEPGITPRLLDPLDAFGHTAVHLADADQPHAFVMHIPRLRDRRTESLCDADQDVALRDPTGDAVSCAEAVLERHDDGVGFEQRGDLPPPPRRRPRPLSR